MPKISVILPTYNRLGQLKKAITGLEKQTYPADEFDVVIVSDGSSDGTNEYLQALKTPFVLQLVLQENQGVAAARNNAIAAADGEMLIFIDDDIVPAPTLVEEHIATHRAADDQNLVVLGPMLTPTDFDMAPWVRWEQKMLEKQYEHLVAGTWEASARQFYTGNTSLLRRHIVDAGGFDPNFRRAEDVELAYRLQDRGLRFVFNKNAVGYHYAQRSFASWLQIPYAYGRNDVIMQRDKGQDWLIPQVAEEFKGRNLLIRLIALIGIDRPFLSSVMTWKLKTLALLGDKLHTEALPRYAYSGIFNLRYYQGMADELGGGKMFWKKMNLSE